MLDSTFLSRSFSDQGARIRIRKETRVQTPAQASRKRKLEIPTEQCILHVPPTTVFNSSHNTNSGRIIAQSPPLVAATSVPGSYYERRASVTSSGTESCSSDESPITTHFSSPRASLPSLSPPQQCYDKFFPSVTSNCHAISYSAFPCSPPPYVHHPLSIHQKSDFDLSVKLPPIRSLIPSSKRQRTSRTEQDAAVAMMQLSHSYNNTPATRTKQLHHLLHLN